VANRNATRMNRMARAARCAGVTCTRHLQGVAIERFRRADWLHRSQRGVRPVHAGPVGVGRADALRVAITEVMAAHDAKSLWGTLRATPEGAARAMASRAHGGKGTDRGPSWISSSGPAVTSVTVCFSVSFADA